MPVMDRKQNHLLSKSLKLIERFGSFLSLPTTASTRAIPAATHYTFKRTTLSFSYYCEDSSGKSCEIMQQSRGSRESRGAIVIDVNEDEKYILKEPPVP
jgi:hypothetical protein